ncbi:MAG: hypothetical protein QNJ29_06440 [Rhizobiaceae bacterium]|nr:hypothetical protein [Rhizobiaceae bacterium]
MTREQLLSSVWVRMIIFGWMIVFPLVFVVLPMIEMFFGRAEESWTPVCGLIAWMLGPWVVSILMKYVGVK